MATQLKSLASLVLATVLVACGSGSTTASQNGSAGDVGESGGSGNSATGGSGENPSGGSGADLSGDTGGTSTGGAGGSATGGSGDPAGGSPSAGTGAAPSGGAGGTAAGGAGGSLTGGAGGNVTGGAGGSLTGGAAGTATGGAGGDPTGGSAGQETGGETGTGGSPALECDTPAPTSGPVAADANGVTFTLNAGLLRLDVCQADIIRVRYTTASSIPAKTSLSVVADACGTPSFCVDVDSESATITTARMKALVNTSNGVVSYTDLNDTVVLSEDSKSTTPTTVEGVSTNQIETVFNSPADEALFGLGQHQDNVMNRKGTNRRIENHNTEINVPLLLSNRGYGIFWDNYSASDFYGRESNNTQYRYVSEAGELVDYYFFYGPRLDHVIALYRTATGVAPLFPKWAYGLFHSKDKYGSQNELLEVMRGYRDNNIPIDCIVQDWDYWTPYSWGSHLMDESRYPDPVGLMNTFHDAHIHGMISIWPEYEYVASPRSSEDQDNYNALDAIGALFPSGGTHHFYDTFNSEARTLVYQQIYDRLLGNYGWDGIWADNTEPQPYPDSINMRAVDTALGKGALYINAYPLQHAKALYEGWRSVGPNDKRVYVLTRSAFAGQQRYAATTWSGDIDCNFETYARQVPAGLNYAAAGMPYWTTDIGGYWGHPDRMDWTTSAANEMFTRWFQYGAFCPIFRIHGGGSRELYGNQWSAATRANLLTIDNLRYRLMPYIYSLAWKVTSEGYTIMRPLVFDYPNDSQVFDIKDQFLFGPAFLVNPVTAAGVTSRSVYLPAGTWYDFWTGSTLAGGASAAVDAPLSEIPLFVKAGSIVPMGPAIQYATESVDPLEIRIYAGQDGSFTLYEDEGDGYAYETGACSQIQFTWTEATQQLTVGARTGSYTGMPANRQFNIVRVGANHGAGVELGTGDQVVDYTGAQVTVTVN
jgi:alpha-D-xyloside xylohydrolase